MYSGCLELPSNTKFLKRLIFPSPRVFCLTGPSEHDPFLLYTWQRPKQYTCSDSTVKRVPKTAVWRTCHLWIPAMSWELWAGTNTGHLSGVWPRVNGAQSRVHQLLARRDVQMCYFTTAHLKMVLIQWRTQEFFPGGRGSTNSVEDTENGDLRAVAPLVRGSGDSCNLVQEISFHIVKFS